MLIAGYSLTGIAECLTELGRRQKLGNTKWSSSSVRDIILNERHCGVFWPERPGHQIIWIINPKQNRGNRNQYRMRDHHEAIASHEIYDAAVQDPGIRKFRPGQLSFAYARRDRGRCSERVRIGKSFLDRIFQRRLSAGLPECLWRCAGRRWRFFTPG